VGPDGQLQNSWKDHIISKEHIQGHKLSHFDSGLTKKFSIKTGVRQGCLLSSFLFLLAIDWAMKETISDSRNGIQWTLVDQLEDPDFANDLALLSHTHSQMQEKTSKLEAISSKLGLKINTNKTKIMRVNSKSNEHISIANRNIEDVCNILHIFR